MCIVFYSLVLMKPACLLPNFCFYCFDLLWMERLFCVFINAQERTIEGTWGMEMSILYNFCKELWGIHMGQESYSDTWQNSLLSICLAASPLMGNLHWLQKRRPCLAFSQQRFWEQCIFYVQPAYQEQPTSGTRSSLQRMHCGQGRH